MSAMACPKKRPLRGRELEIVGWIGARRASSPQQRDQSALAVEHGQIVEPTNVRFTDINLRHGSATRSRDHFRAPLRFEVDSDRVDLLGPARAQERLGAQAVWAYARAVHRHA